MPYPAKTIKTVIGGTIGAQEIFAFGFQLDGSNVSGQVDLDGVNGACVAALTNNFLVSATLDLFAQAVTFDSVRNYLYTGGTTASLVSESTGINKHSAVAQVALPNQCAVVVTLETGTPGRSHRGRAYLPPVNINALRQDGQLLSSACTQLANSFASMLKALHDDPAPVGRPVVASATKGSMTTVNQVRVDSIVDTQRRRRNKLLPLSSIVAPTL